jgi:hypothetical protein
MQLDRIVTPLKQRLKFRHVAHPALILFKENTNATEHYSNSCLAHQSFVLQGLAKLFANGSEFHQTYLTEKI